MNRSLVWSALLFLTVLALLPWVSEAAGPAAEPRIAKDAQDFVFFSETRPLLVRLHVHIDGKPLEAAWDDFIQHVFKSLDMNGDGVLTKEEAERALTPPMLFNGFFTFGRGFVAPAAKLHDKMTLQQLADYYRKNDGAPFQAQGTPAS